MQILLNGTSRDGYHFNGENKIISMFSYKEICGCMNHNIEILEKFVSMNNYHS